MGTCESFCLKRQFKTEEIDDFKKQHIEEQSYHIQEEQIQKESKSKEFQPKQKNFSEKQRKNNDEKIVVTSKKQDVQVNDRYNVISQDIKLGSYSSDKQESEKQESEKDLVQKEEFDPRQSKLDSQYTINVIANSQNLNLQNKDSIISAEPNYFQRGRKANRIDDNKRDSSIGSRDHSEQNSFIFKSDFSDVNSNQNYNRKVNLINQAYDESNQSNENLTKVVNERQRSRERISSDKYNYQKQSSEYEDSDKDKPLTRLQSRFQYNQSQQDLDVYSDGGTSSNYMQNAQKKVQLNQNEQIEKGYRLNESIDDDDHIIKNINVDYNQQDNKVNVIDRLAQKFQEDAKLSRIYEDQDEQLRTSYAF